LKVKSEILDEHHRTIFLEIIIIEVYLIVQWYHNLITLVGIIALQFSYNKLNLFEYVI